jgi:hypothetical protein
MCGLRMQNYKKWFVNACIIRVRVRVKKKTNNTNNNTTNNNHRLECDVSIYTAALVRTAKRFGALTATLTTQEIYVSNVASTATTQKANPNYSLYIFR